MVTSPRAACCRCLVEGAIPMARTKPKHEFVVVYVKFFRHYRTKKHVFPKPPNRYIKLMIRADKWKAYQDRKRGKAA